MPRQGHHCAGHATEPLRKARNKVHAAFDPLWRDGAMPRRTAYLALAAWLGIEPKACHVALFDVDQCTAALEFVAAVRPTT